MIRTSLLPVSLLCLLSACGGGGGSSNQPAAPAATFAGLYAIGDLSDCGFPPKPINGVIEFPESYATGLDTLVVDANNIAYRACGNTLWVGQMNGALTANNDAGVNAPLSGTGNARFNLFHSGGRSAGIQDMAGTILARPSGRVTSIKLSNGLPSSSPDSVALERNKDVLLDDPSKVETLTKSYATLAGAFNEADYYRYDATTPNGALTVNSNGSFSGSTTAGSFAGTITSFDADSGIHAVEATLTTSGGTIVTAKGLLAPSYGDSGSLLDYRYVMVALTGNGVGYAATYKRAP